MNKNKKLNELQSLFSIVHGDCELKRLKCEQFLIAGENMRLIDI